MPTIADAELQRLRTLLATTVDLLTESAKITEPWANTEEWSTPGDDLDQAVRDALGWSREADQIVAGFMNDLHLPWTPPAKEEDPTVKNTSLFVLSFNAFEVLPDEVKRAHLAPISDFANAVVTVLRNRGATVSAVDRKHGGYTYHVRYGGVPQAVSSDDVFYEAGLIVSPPGPQNPLTVGDLRLVANRAFPPDDALVGTDVEFSGFQRFRSFVESQPPHFQVTAMPDATPVEALPIPSFTKEDFNTAAGALRVVQDTYDTSPNHADLIRKFEEAAQVLREENL